MVLGGLALESFTELVKVDGPAFRLEAFDDLRLGIESLLFDLADIVLIFTKVFNQEGEDSRRFSSFVVVHFDLHF